MRITISCCAALFLLTHVAPLPALAALSYEEAQSVASSARTLEREGRSRDAVALVRQKSQECGGADDARPCRLLLQFTLGGLLEQQALLQPGAGPQLLEEAATHYGSILNDVPNHAATVKALALVYRRLGEPARAEALLRRSADAFPNHGVLGALLGDFYRAEGRLDRALDAYKRAADTDPEAEIPRRRLIELYVELHPPRFADLMKVLIGLESRFPSVAEFGYRSIIDRTYRTQPAIAEESFARWVSVLARDRRITRASLESLPSGWTPRPVADLRRYMEAPGQLHSSMWWRERPERSQVLIEVGLALGHQRLLERDPKGAAEIWETGVRFAPDFAEYMFGPLKGQNMVTLDLQTELASLYFKYPSLDPGDRKFNAVVNRLFQSKGEAYKADDLRAIQRHHTILGTIFAQKKIWRSSHWALNGIFQLENAIKIAGRRDERDGSYQPLPELRAMLAEGKQTLGDRDQARALYLRAAQAYLDADQLDKTGEALDRAGRLMSGQPPQERDLRAQLERVLGTRHLIETAAPEALDPSAATFAFRRDGAQAWLFGARLAALSESFLARQRFKTLADLAERSGQLGHAAAAADYAAEAFNIAVDQVSHLTGASDVVRLQKIRPQATQNKVIDQRPITIERARTQTSQQSKSWVVAIPAEPTPTYVGLGSDDLLAARIVRELKSDPNFSKDIPFAVKQGRVTIPEGEQSVGLKQSLEKIRGVGAVSVTPKTR